MIKHVVGLALTPLLAYPATFAGLAAADTLRGERLVAFHVRHDQRALWDTFWGDFAASLPATYLAAIALIVVFVALRRTARARASPWALVPLAAAGGWGVATYLVGSWASLTHVSLAASWAVVGLPLAFFLSRILSHASGDATS